VPVTNGFAIAALAAGFSISALAADDGWQARVGEALGKTRSETPGGVYHDGGKLAEGPKPAVEQINIAKRRQLRACAAVMARTGHPVLSPG
jgi:hypothetical protein